MVIHSSFTLQNFWPFFNIMYQRIHEQQRSSFTFSLSFCSNCKIFISNIFASSFLLVFWHVKLVKYLQFDWLENCSYFWYFKSRQSRNWKKSKWINLKRDKQEVNRIFQICFFRSCKNDYQSLRVSLTKKNKVKFELDFINFENVNR